LFGDPVVFVARLPAILVGLTFHECAHALAAYYCGDPTAKHAGRLTLNPLAHLDPLGTICILFAPIGWAKPVPVNPYNFRKPWAEYLVSLAGVGTNLLMAIVAGLLVRLLLAARVTLPAEIWFILFFMIIINIGLALFNILPLYPLDGSHVMQELLPYRYKEDFARFSRYGPIIILVLAISGGLSGILWGPMRVIARIVAGSEFMAVFGW
jgi:Zn-dependent protease